MPASTRVRSSPLLFKYDANWGLTADGLIWSLQGNKVVTGTFDRGGTTGAASAVDSNSRVYIPGYKSPRFHYISGNRTVLLEGARTNACVQSSDLTTTWTALAQTPTKDATGPDGALNSGSTISTTGATSYARNNSSGTITAGQVNVVSAHIKAGTAAWVSIADVADAANHIAWFNPATGALGAVSGCTSALVSTLTNGWYRVRITYTATNTYTGDLRIQPCDADSGSTNTNPKTVLVYGVQWEKNVAFVSSFIPTTTVAVTRAADALSFPFGFAPAAMTVYADFYEGGTALGGLGLWHIGTGGAAVTQAGIVGDASGGKYRVYADFTDGAGYAQGQTTAPTFGAQLELRSVLAASGPLTTGQSISGGTEEVLTNAATRTFDATWSAQTLSIGSYSGGAAGGFAALRSLKIAALGQTMATVRAA